ADPSKSLSLVLTVLPPGAIRINAGSEESYTDSRGRTWWPDVGYLSGGFASFSDLPLSDHPDPTLYRKCHSAVTDVYYRFGVPNGSYRITVGMVNPSHQGGHYGFHLESQGQMIHRYVDPFAKAGGASRPVELDLPATVKDGTLTLVLRMGG